MLCRLSTRCNTNAFASARVFRNVNVINPTFNPFSSDYYCIYGLLPIRTDDEQSVRETNDKCHLICFVLFLIGMMFHVFFLLLRNLCLIAVAVVVVVFFFF